MKEDFLHYVWKFKKFASVGLATTSGEPILVFQVGHHNLDSGPDFFNAQLSIDGQLWAGNVEIHVKSSDWYHHNHEIDSTYDNVILHVVYDHDTDIFRKDNTKIPTLELKNYISNDLLNNYHTLFDTKNKWINCESDFELVDDFVLKNWLENLYFERLERKSKTIDEMLRLSNNDWEAVLFKLLAKNFGLQVNGGAFLSMASSFDFSIIRKSRNKPEILEALFFGQIGLLESSLEEAYHITLKKDYAFLKQKFNISSLHVLPVKFFRLRPPNFPTLRLSQLAMLYHKEPNLFSKIITATTLEELYALLKVTTTNYWSNHYTFDKQTKSTRKYLTKPFMDLLIINTILPIKFCYGKYIGNTVDEVILSIVEQIDSEKNNIVDAFNSLKSISQSAMQSQALIQLKTEYCSKNRCLQCSIGNSLINKPQLENLDS